MFDFASVSSAASYAACASDALRVHFVDFRFREASLLFLVDQLHFGIGALQCVLGVADFACRSGTLFLQPAKRVEVSLRSVALGSRLHELRFARQHFFLGSASLNRADVRLCRSQLCQRSRRLSPGIGIVKLHEQLALLDAVALFHQQSSSRWFRRARAPQNSARARPSRWSKSRCEYFLARRAPRAPSPRPCAWRRMRQAAPPRSRFRSSTAPTGFFWVERYSRFSSSDSTEQCIIGGFAVATKPLCR